MASARFEYVVIGAGAIGSIIAAHLARAGRRVAIVARGRRALQVEEQGLRIRGLSTFEQPLSVITDASRCGGTQALILATKALDTGAVIEPFRSVPLEATLSIQNGLMKNEHLARVFGAERVLGAIANISGELRPDGEVMFTRNEFLAIGERGGGISERTRQIAATLDDSGVHTQAAEDIDALEWSKFASWAGLMLLSITTRETTGRFLMDPDGARLVARIVREIGALAGKWGVALNDRSTLPAEQICNDPEARAVASIQSIGRDMHLRAPEHRMSSLQDLLAHRPLEIEETLGYVLKLAAERLVSVPLLAALYPLAAAIDRVNREQPPNQLSTHP